MNYYYYYYVTYHTISSEYWRKDEKATIVLPGKRLSFKVQINNFFGFSGNTIVDFLSLHQYSLLVSAIHYHSELPHSEISIKKILNDTLD